MNKLLLISLAVILFFISTNKTYSQTLSDNGIEGYTKLSDALQDPGKADKIWISGNETEINHLTANADGLKNVSSLKIKEGANEAGWEKLFKALSKSMQLKELELTFNEIKTIPSNISDFKYLEKLVIWGSPNLNYSALMKNLSGLDHLKTLELYSNGLTEVPNEIKLLKRLENFTVNDNENIDYSSLIEKLESLPNLSSLSLEVNSITQLPADIIKLKNLKKLNISNNYISSLPDKMSNLSNLDSLSADGNLFVNYVDEFNKLKGINIKYISVDGGLSEEEKAELLKLFPQTKIEEKTEAESNLKTNSSEAADLFAPIVPELNAAKTNYIVDADKGAEINYPTGTQIKIPESSFVDKNNLSVKGSVTIAYREFTNPFEIAFSGIPMNYNKAGLSIPLESAGMFELNASQNNQPVFIKKGKEIAVSLASSDSTNDYNLYKIDTTSKVWEDLGQHGTIKIVKRKAPKFEGPSVPQPPAAFSSTWQNYRNLIHENDSVLFKDRFYDTSYCHLAKYSFSKSGDYSRFVKLNRYRRESRLFKKPEKKDVWFNMSNYLYPISNSNPELRAFNGMTWVYEGAETPREFYAKYVRKKRYSDVRIEKEGDSFKILLKENGGITTFNAHPILKFKGSLEKAQKKYDRRYRNYTKGLVRREANFNRNLMYNRRYVYKDNKDVWKGLKPMMSEKEKLMSYDQWLLYFRNINTYYYGSVSKTQASLDILNSSFNSYRRNISITQLGYYNFDRPLLKIISLPLNAADALVRSGYKGYKALTEPKEYVTIKVAYSDKQNNKLTPKKVMMIDRRINSTAYLGNGTSMTVALNSKKNLFAVMDDGSVGLFSEDDFKQIGLADKGNYTFSLTMYQPYDLGKLKEYLKY